MNKERGNHSDTGRYKGKLYVSAWLRLFLFFIAFTSCHIDADLKECSYNARLEYWYTGSGSANVLPDYIYTMHEFLFDSLGVLRQVNETVGKKGIAAELNVPPGKYTLVAWANVDSASHINQVDIGHTTKEEMLLYLDNPYKALKSESAYQGNAERLYYGFATFYVNKWGVTRQRIDMTHSHCLLNLTVKWKYNPPRDTKNFCFYLLDVPSEYRFLPGYEVRGSASMPYQEPEYPITRSGSSSYIPLKSDGQKLVDQRLDVKMDITRTLSGEFNFTASGDNKVAKISVYAGNKKSFFFVANGREHLSLDSLELHVTDTTAFARKATNVQNGLLECPLLMSGFYDMPNVATAIAGGAIEVTLVRRVARFDLQNNSDDSGFIIKEIVVSNARGGNYIFDGNATAYEASLLVKLPIIDFTPFPNANYGESNSVLYMYPTKIAGETELSLVGVMAGSGAPQVYTVKFKPNQTDSDDKLIQIKPNTRYLLSVLSLGTGYINATLKVNEWVVGDTINTQTGYGTIKLSDKGGKALENSAISISAEPLLTDSVLINVAASSEWELFVDSKYDWISVTALPGDTVMRSFKAWLTLGAALKSEDVKNQTGIGSGAISVLPKANTTEAARQDTVTITIAGVDGKSNLVQRLIVSQAPRNLGSIQLRMVGMTDEKITIEAAGFSDADSKREVKVIANTAWKIIKDADWLSIDAEEGSNTGNGSFKLKADANIAVERKATITVQNTINANIKKIITITQAGI